MPSYDYYCPTNGKTLEVTHRMSELLKFWGEVCDRAGIEPGDTPANSPVQKLITGGQFISTSGPTSDTNAAISGSSCCNVNGCGCH